MYHVSAQGVDERMLNIQYYYYVYACVRECVSACVCLRGYVRACVHVYALDPSTAPGLLSSKQNTHFQK